MKIETVYTKHCWLCCGPISPKNDAGHICSDCLDQEMKLWGLAEPASIKHCPECGATLETCPYTDYKGRYWYWCSNCDCYWHEDDLANIVEQIAQHADAVDYQRMITELRQGLY